ncbi:MAG: glycosyltransferase [Candidatus Pacebacteria bacterium]|nr:glycosyltransferase [Candidatus Paceibacterota bacterium]
MKKVLIFSLQYYPFVGGAEVAIKEITDRMPLQEFEFHMVTARFDTHLPKNERIGNVIVHRIGLATKSPSIGNLKKFPLHLNKYLFQLLAPLKAMSLHRKHSFSMTWGMMAHATAIPAGIFKYLHPEVPYLLTLQEGDPTEHIERMMRPVWPLFAQGFRKADALQPISTFLLLWGKRMGFTGDSNVIPNGVDIELFATPQDVHEIEKTKESLGKKPGDIFLVTTSRLVHKNAIDDVIHALPLLPENISFLVYGIGPDEQMLRKLSEDLGVLNRVRFMGHIDHQDMPLMLASADIFIRPSRSEGMGNSFIEAMAAGVPVIATQEGGLSDFLFDEARNPGIRPTGWAVDANSPEQIVRAVVDILANPQKVRDITLQAQKQALEGYGWASIASSMEELFSRLTG